VRFAAKSDRGIVRELNEDNYKLITGYEDVPDVFVVADGMGVTVRENWPAVWLLSLRKVHIGAP